MAQTARPIYYRILHAFGEAMLSFIFAAGVYLASIQWICRVPYRCSEMRVIPYAIGVAVLAVTAWSIFLTLCRRNRHRLPARFRLDAGIAIATVALWAAAYVLER